MNFSIFEKIHKTYGGANGSKIGILIDGSPYMLKFPTIPTLNNEMSYSNSCISEYLGSHIFNMLGIPAQETILGTYRINGIEKIAVACKDFTGHDIILQDFASLKNTIIESSRNGYGTELSDILSTIEAQDAVDSLVLTEHFWNMFVVDAFIGNWDRHNGNWGFLYNQGTDSVSIAPIFDCGSSLFPQADASIMESVLNDPAERNARIYNMPLSSIKMNGKKINYYEFLSSHENADCDASLKRIVPRIHMKDIDNLLEQTPYITDLQRSFYHTMLQNRKERILDWSLEMILRREYGRTR